MTASYDLKEGKYDQSLRSSEEVDEILTCFFEDSAKKTSTYKYAMFKSIMDCLKLTTNKTYKISFDLLFSRFAEIYWVLVYQYKIPQKAFSIKASETIAEKIISIITNKYKIRRKTHYADLPSSIRSELVKQMKRNCSRYVFGALYAETEQILYSFSIDKEWIKVNPQIVSFLDKHGNAIQNQNYQAWGNYYVKIEAVEGKNSGYYQRLLRREFSDNAVFPIKQQSTPQIPKTRKKEVTNKSSIPSKNDAIETKKVRDMLSQYPDLGLYLAQICWKLNLDKDKAKIILENSYWCRKEGSRYYYVNISDSDILEEALFQDESMDYDEVEDIPVQESNSILDSDNIMLLNDPEKLIKKLKREKNIDRRNSENMQPFGSRRKQKDNSKKITKKDLSTSKWEREEVVILVADYFRTKHMSFSEIKASQGRLSEFLRKRKESISGEPANDVYRNAASILIQFSRLRALDPSTGYSKMQGTKIQKEVMKEYLENPKRINEEAAKIYKKYNWISTDY